MHKNCESPLKYIQEFSSHVKQGANRRMSCTTTKDIPK